jgi:hypothetical protein
MHTILGFVDWKNAEGRASSQRSCAESEMLTKHLKAVANEKDGFWSILWVLVVGPQAVEECPITELPAMSGQEG